MIGGFITQHFVWIMLVAIVVSTGAMVLVRKHLGITSLREHHEVSDPLLACVGTLFAVLIGFMVASAMGRFEEARLNVEREAGAVSDIYRLSLGLPEDVARQFQVSCGKYIDCVVDIEWKEMEERRMSQRAWDEYGSIWTSCLRFEPQSDRQTNIHASMLGCMITLGDCRRVRATQMSYELPPVLWVVVLLGAVSTGALVLFFGIQHQGWQIATNALVTLVLCLNVFLLATYDVPFSGHVKVQPYPFEVARKTLPSWRAWLKNESSVSHKEDAKEKESDLGP
jgi:hypothetical protein